MEDKKEEIKLIIEKCDNELVIDYLLTWIKYSIEYYQAETHQ